MHLDENTCSLIPVCFHLVPTNSVHSHGFPAPKPLVFEDEAQASGPQPDFAMNWFWQYTFCKYVAVDLQKHAHNESESNVYITFNVQIKRWKDHDCQYRRNENKQHHETECDNKDGMGSFMILDTNNREDRLLEIVSWEMISSFTANNTVCVLLGFKHKTSVEGCGISAFPWRVTVLGSGFLMNTFGLIVCLVPALSPLALGRQ